MGLVVDKISGQIFLFDIPSSSGSGTTTTYPQVNTYSQLPNAALYNNIIYVVLQPSGAYVATRKEAGLYYSNGVIWTRLGDIPSFFNDNNFEIYDGNDNTRKLKFELSGVTSNHTRIVKARDKNGTLGYLEDLTGYTATTTMTTYYKYNSGATPTQYSSSKIFVGQEITDSNGVVTFYLTTNGLSGGTAIFNSIHSVEAIGQNNTSSVASIPITSVKAITNGKILTVNVVQPVTIILGGLPLAFVGAGVKVNLTVRGV